MIECLHCKAQFQIKFDDEDDEVRYCPSCGEELIGEIQFVDDDILIEDLDEDEWN